MRNMKGGPTRNTTKRRGGGIYREKITNFVSQGEPGLQMWREGLQLGEGRPK